MAENATPQTREEQAKARLLKVNERLNVLESVSRFTAEQLLVLIDDLDPARVSVLKQKGGMSYVEAHDVKSMLTRVFGFGGFSSELTESRIISIKPKDESGKQFLAVCLATCKVTIHGVNGFADAIYTESSISSQTGNNEGDTAEFALKTAASDAFKRAAVFLGTQFGSSLYADGATADQVKVLFEPVQAEILALGRERRRIHAFLAAASGQGAPSAPSPAQSGAPAGSGAQNGAQALQGSMNQGTN